MLKLTTKREPRNIARDEYGLPEYAYIGVYALNGTLIKDPAYRLPESDDSNPDSRLCEAFVELGEARSSGDKKREARAIENLLRRFSNTDTEIPIGAIPSLTARYRSLCGQSRSAVDEKLLKSLSTISRSKPAVRNLESYLY